MYKILVIDEEQSIIEMIIETINYNVDRARVVGYAKTSKAALNRAREIKPDIIIIGIKISGINGLEIIKLVKVLLPTVHIIIVSEYDYFDFAREAIVLEVDDYLLKPINKTIFVDSINKVISKIEKEKEKIKVEHNRALLQKSVFEFAEQSLIYSISFNNKLDEDISRYKEVMELDDYGYIMAVENRGQVFCEMQELEIEAKGIYDCIKEIISEEYKAVIGPKLFNRIVVLISTDEKEMPEYKQKEKSIILANSIKQTIKERIGIDVTIGIGNNQKIEMIHSSYEDAIKSLYHNLNINKIMHILDVKDSIVLNQKDYRKTEEKLLESIKRGKEEAIGIFCVLLDLIKKSNQQDKRNKIMELLVLSCYAARTFSQNDDAPIDYSKYFEELKHVQDHQVETWALKKFHFIYNIMRTSKSDNISDIINRARKYMEEHYSEGICLEDISRYVSITPQYFSKLFKEQTGHNFVEWITNIRMEKAKELMSGTDKKIKEICYLVGYNDSNYFSRIFRKMEGISPTDYMNGKDVASNLKDRK